MQGHFVFWRIELNYIIFDLEWNSSYNHTAHKFMNEIIEIGAVKLDSKLNVVDSYKQLVYPAFTKKLSSRCKRLTGITNEEIKENSVDFKTAFRDFARWSSGRNNVFLSWSNSDLYVLATNFIENTGSPKIGFIKNYCDAQKYCMSFIHRADGEQKNQISLANCAEMFDIDVDTEKLHRALTDCYVTAECLKKVYDKNKIKDYIKPCDNTFFERLFFKPFYITEPVYDDFSIFKVDLLCPSCGKPLDSPREFDIQNKAFKGATMCQRCKKPYWVFIRAKKLYDNVQVKTTYVEMNSKRAKKLNGKNYKK